MNIRPAETPATPSDVRWEQRAERLEVDTLREIRAAGQKLMAGLGTLTSLFGIVVIVRGPAEVQDLSGVLTVGPVSVSVSGLAVGLLVGTVAAAVVATALAGHVSQGALREFMPVGAELRKMWRRETRSAARILRWARCLAVLASTLLVLTATIVWSADSTGSDPSIQVTTVAGSQVCGRLLDVNDGELRLEAKSGTEVSLALSEVDELLVVGSCT